MQVEKAVSVVMGVHNGETQLEDSITSILNQQEVELELILVDDGSTDRSLEVMRQFARSDDRVKLLEIPHSGLTRALIVGCAAASHAFIARHDVGDYSAENRFKKQLELFESDASLVFTSCLHTPIGPGNEVLGKSEPSDGGISIISGLMCANGSELKGPHHGSVMFSRSHYELVGGYRSEFYFAQDIDLWSRLIEVGKLGFVNEPMYWVRFDSTSITTRYREEQVLLYELIKEATQLRRSGRSEKLVLEKAEKIGPKSNSEGFKNQKTANYFIGSCLYKQGDSRARKYLRSHLGDNPVDLGAWMKLIASHWFHRR